MEGTKKFAILLITLLSIIYIAEGLLSSAQSFPAENISPHKGYFD